MPALGSSEGCAQPLQPLYHGPLEVRLEVPHTQAQRRRVAVDLKLELGQRLRAVDRRVALSPSMFRLTPCMTSITCALPRLHAVCLPAIRPA